MWDVRIRDSQEKRNAVRDEVSPSRKSFYTMENCQSAAPEAQDKAVPCDIVPITPLLSERWGG